MHLETFLTSALILLLILSLTVSLSKHAGLGSILGLLLAGTIVGPEGLGSYATDQVELLHSFTELGVVLLLFVIGLEMKPQKLWEMRKEVFGLGLLQILVSGGAIGLYLWGYVGSLLVALIIGLTLALSSTAFVMQLLVEKNETSSKHGKGAFAILLMQDLAVIPLLAILPMASGAESSQDGSWGWLGLLSLGAIIFVVVFGRYLLPLVLERVARQRNDEAFMFVVLLSVLIPVLVMQKVGLSMALGAFMIGMLLSTSKFHYQIEAQIEPFRGVLMSLFFVAVGMSISVQAIVSDPLLLLQHLAVILSIKIVVLFGLALYFGYGRGGGSKMAFLLSQNGEFGFVLFGAAKASGLIGDAVFITGISMISLSMVLTPLLARVGDMIAARIDHARFGFAQSAHHSLDDEHPDAVIVGFGRSGQVVANMLRGSGVECVIIEQNTEKVALGQQEEYPIYYGNAANYKLLESLKLDKVGLLVITIDHPTVAARIARHARDLSPTIKILARAKDSQTWDALRLSGANWVIQENVEANLRLGNEVLRHLGMHTEGAHPNPAAL